jgi:amino acid transporter
MQEKSLGTFAVFMTAISTILGAVLFLRFGHAIGHVGLGATLLIIVIGHLVTIPAAFAVAEIATNQKVEGGGAYFMISRSFGLSIGGAIGIALFLSQAISVAFYIIAFTISTRDVLAWLEATHQIIVSPAAVNYGFMALLTALMLTKGAQVGVKALYVVVAILFVALASFFLGTGETQTVLDVTATIPSQILTPDNQVIERFDFFAVFTFIFPAFTGIAAGLGLSGDLKDPARAIPRGTLIATVVGIVVYLAVSFKFWLNASPEALVADELYMEQIALWPILIPIGLAAAAVSSALGSVMVAPRTLQALAVDKILPGKLSDWLARARAKDGEPIAASIITCAIGFAFVSLGDINAVAEIISMFFLVTYGAICMVSVLEHLAASPSYRPTFRSHWLLSAVGAVTCFYLMFKMNFAYATGSLLIMGGIYAALARRGSRNMVSLFRGILFQASRRLQLTLQRRDSDALDRGDWRPIILAISPDTFTRPGAFEMVRWLAHKQGFGTYVHLVEGLLNPKTIENSARARRTLVKMGAATRSRVSVSSIVSPSYTSAMAQCIQLPGVSGKGSNTLLIEYSDEDMEGADQLVKNYDLLRASRLDLVLLRSSIKGFGDRKRIHLWITPDDSANANLMILMAYILQGHPDWRHSHIEVFCIHHGEDELERHTALTKRITEDRIPIAPQNIQMVLRKEATRHRALIGERSRHADLTFIGFSKEKLQTNGRDVFESHHGIGNILFVDAHDQMNIR